MTVGIAGLGLIGGSIGLALREPGRRILGFDPDPAAREIAKSRFCLDEEVSLPDLAQADIVFVCAPPDAIVQVAEEISIHRGAQTWVSDCGSVKSDIARWATAAGADWFVPGHPMAGHEKGTARYSTQSLFRDSRWLLTPSDKTNSKAVKAIESLVIAMGAKPIRLVAAEHDQHVAVLSHLPHLVANALEAVAAPLSQREISGGSWKDLTRVAGADPALWSQILAGNADAVSAAIDAMITELELAKQVVATGDRDQLRLLLRAASERKRVAGK
jgi:prephenate dehydrogenase